MVVGEVGERFSGKTKATGTMGKTTFLPQIGFHVGRLHTHARTQAEKSCADVKKASGGHFFSSVFLLPISSGSKVVAAGVTLDEMPPIWKGRPQSIYLMRTSFL